CANRSSTPDPEITMDSLLRSLAIFAFLLIMLRLAGQRTLSEMTSFDFVLLMLLSETAQQAMLDMDFSLTNSLLLIAALIGVSVLLSIVKFKFPRIEKWLDGTALIVVENGQPLRDRMRKARVDEEDIMEAARELQGLERIEQIKYAVLERGGNITIIPVRSQA